MANAGDYDWRTIGVWVAVGIIAVLVIAWLAGAFERTAETPAPEAPQTTAPAQPEPTQPATPPATQPQQ